MSTILYLSPGETQLWQLRRKRWTLTSDAPLAATAKTSEASLIVICDLPEESIADIEMPPLRGRDRADFLTRQQQTRFPDTRYHATLSLRGSKRSARGRVLLIGIAAQGRLDQVLLPLVDARRKIAGVWPVSSLLSALAQSQKLPETLFIAFPGPAGLRIVFTKDRVPILSRLAPSTDSPEAIVEELSRTRRYLENSRAIERGDVHYPLLYLGDGQAIDEGLKKLRLDQTLLPPALAPKTVSNASEIGLPLLFELASKSPFGQTAPLAIRRHFLADRLKKIALAAAASALALSVWAASGNLSAISGSLSAAEQTRQMIEQANQETMRIDEAIVARGVSADTVRQAVDLEKRELTAIPDLRSRLTQLSRTIGEIEGLRLTQLNWTLRPEREACTGDTPVVGAESPLATPETNTGANVVELDFSAQLPENMGPRAQAHARQRLSDLLLRIPDATLKNDPNRTLKAGALAGGAARDKAGSGGEGLRWCMTLRIAQAPGS